MARALILNVSCDTEAENVRCKWRHVFYGSPLATPDSGEGEVLITLGMTATQIKSSIKSTIQADANRLGIGSLDRVPQHVEEVFHNL